MTFDHEDPLEDSPGRDPSDAARLVVDDATPPPGNLSPARLPRRWLPWLVMGVTVAGMLAWGAAEALSAGPPAQSFPGPRTPQRPAEPMRAQAGAALAADPPSAGSGIVTPPAYAPPLTFDKWTAIPADAAWKTYRGPTTLVNVWIDPATKHVKLADGGTAYDAIRDLCSDFARVSGAGFVEVPWSRASIRIRHLTPDWIYYLSATWGSYGDTRVGGVYYAAKAGHPEVCFCHYNKLPPESLWTPAGGWNWSKAKPLGSLNVKRIVAYGLLLHWGWPPQQQGAPSFAARNPNLSGAINYPDPEYPLWRKTGVAGFDETEIGWIGRKFPGHLWQMKRTRHLTPKRNGGTY